MSKYNVKFCSCGRIHMVPYEKLEPILEKDKNLLLICAGCGAAMLVGADIESNIYSENDDNSMCYNMYTYDYNMNKDKYITLEDFNGTKEFKGIEEIFYSHGIKVPMLTGNYSNCYNDGYFYDTTNVDTEEIEHKISITKEEILKIIKEHNYKSNTVDMRRFINENEEDDLKSISGYALSNLIWDGTKYDRCSTVLVVDVLDYVNTKTELVVKDIIKWCNSTKSHESDIIEKLIKDNMLYLKDKCVINKVPFNSFSERSKISEWLEYEGFSLYKTSK